MNCAAVYAEKDIVYKSATQGTIPWKTKAWFTILRLRSGSLIHPPQVKNRVLC